MHEHDDEWDYDDGEPVNEDEDDEADEDDGVEDEIAAYAVDTWLEIEGHDELAEAQRELLVAIAQEALAKKERREAREAAARRRRQAQDRAEADERIARREAERLAQQAHQRAVEEAHARVAPIDPLAHSRATLAVPARTVATRPVVSGSVATRGVRPVMPVPAKRHPVAVPPHDEDLDDRRVENDDLDEAADDFREAARVALADALPDRRPPVQRVAEEPIRYLSGDEAAPLTGSDLTAWRTRHGLTQQAAADRLGVRQGTVSKAEGRSGALLGPALRDALADVLADDRPPRSSARHIP
jgi:hypothetical protein